MYVLEGFYPYGIMLGRYCLGKTVARRTYGSAHGRSDVWGGNLERVGAPTENVFLIVPNGALRADVQPGYDIVDGDELR